MTPLFTKDLPIDTINDVTYIAKVAMFTQGVVVRDESPFKTIEEFIAFAKANPRKLKVGVPGVGSTGHLAVSLFNKDAGVELVPVPFGGGGRYFQRFWAGMWIAPLWRRCHINRIIPQARFVILAFFSNKRHPVYPNVPTTAEKGLKRTIAEVGMALVGPKGLSTEIVKKWEEYDPAGIERPAGRPGHRKTGFCRRSRERRAIQERDRG